MSWLENSKPALILAPMEGVTDAPMRTLLTEVGGFTHCVTEFLRVTQEIYPDRVFREHAEELDASSKTPSGIPVFFQLLGGNPEKLALTAQIAVRLGAAGIDLNFGCPAPTVNRHDGGATLLKHPHRIFEIVKSVREAVPAMIPVSAKLRLGWEKIHDIFENAEAAVKGGASWLTIHGRTKTQGYTPPAYWDPIGVLRSRYQIPIVANGEIWTLDDFRRCREVTGCSHFMVGRGAVANPYLARQIARELGIDSSPQEFSEALFPSEEEWLVLTHRFLELCTRFAENPNYAVRRLKQWFKLVDSRQPQNFFEKLKTAKTIQECLDCLTGSARRFESLSKVPFHKEFSF